MDSIATEMVGHFKETGHPVSLGISAVNRGILKRKGGRCTIHFIADSSNSELLFRTIHSANQLSIYGAVSRWCEELAQWIRGQNELTVEKSVAKENEQLLKKCEAARSILWNKLQGATVGHPETDCENNFSIREKSLCWDELQNYS